MIHLTMKKRIPKAVSRHLAAIGSKGGKKSRRILTPEQAREMVRIREAKRKSNEGV
jgi:hypothetical protein